MTSDGYKFIKFSAIEPIDMSKCEPIETDAPPDVILKESIFDLIRMAKEVGASDDLVDGVLNSILEERAQEIRGSFKMHGGEGGDT